MDDNPEESGSAGTDGYDLDAIEVRVLAVLIEKSFVTPDSYPLSINGIVTGCNQLTGREPVMELSEAAVQDAIDRLIERRLVSIRHQASARVLKYEHQIRLRHSLPPAEQAVIALLMLRGPQTAGEIRARCERMYRFGDLGEVEAALLHLSEKYPPMVAILPRAPGTKETRHVHLMSGEDVLQQYADGYAGNDSSAPRGSRLGELEEEVRRLRQQLEWLTGEFEQFRRQFE